jgi:CDP-6-deoxy-D-xylo-4-hexulose-3-dehydrase
VRAFEEGVAALFGKRRGVMCNSGSSALYLASSCSACRAARDRHVAAHVLDRHRADRARGLVPVFVDVEPDTYQIDVARIEEAIGPTRARSSPRT